VGRPAHGFRWASPLTTHYVMLRQADHACGDCPPKRVETPFGGVARPWSASSAISPRRDACSLRGLVVAKLALMVRGDRFRGTSAEFGVPKAATRASQAETRVHRPHDERSSAWRIECTFPNPRVQRQLHRWLKPPPSCRMAGHRAIGPPATPLRPTHLREGFRQSMSFSSKGNTHAATISDFCGI
jgi:hypothetical protein